MIMINTPARDNEDEKKILLLLLNAATSGMPLPEASPTALWDFSSFPPLPRIITGVFRVRVLLEPGTRRVAFKNSPFWTKIDTELQDTFYFRCTKRKESVYPQFQATLLHSTLNMLKIATRKSEGMVREIFVAMKHPIKEEEHPTVALITQRNSKRPPLGTQSSTLVRELSPYHSWRITFKWARTDRSPSAEWTRDWARNLEYPMWRMSQQQHQALMAFFIPFVRLSTAIFCPTQNRFHEACAGSVTEASVVVREPTMPHKLDASDEAAFEKIATILRNPYTKLSLPRPFWHAMNDPSAAAHGLHWMDERSVYEGGFDANRLFHGAGTWTFGKWQYAGQWEHGLPHGLGTITEKDPTMGKIRSVYEGEVSGGLANGFGKKNLYDDDGERVVRTYEGKWVEGELVQGSQKSHYEDTEKHSV